MKKKWIITTSAMNKGGRITLLFVIDARWKGNDFGQEVLGLKDKQLIN